MAISRIGMQTHVYVCIFLIWSFNHATIILCVYVRFTFKWNVDCMDCILMMWGIRFSDYRHHVCQVYIYKKITVVLGLKSRVVTWTIWAGTLVRPDETPQASYGDFIARPRKQASWNSSKHLSTIQQSDQELRTSWAGTLVWSLVFPDETLWVSSCNFSATPMKTASKNACKNLSTIQRSDQELWTIWAGTLVWPDESPQASHGDLIPTPRKQASWNSCKNLSTIQWSDQEFWTSLSR